MTEALQPGVRVRDVYEIVRLLGSSEISRVYLARGSDVRHKFVVKEICPPVDHPRDMERLAEHFRRQVHGVQRLQHPALPRLSEWFVWNGLAYTVREYLEESTLEEVVRRTNGPVPEAQIRTWMAQVCDAFTYLHAQQPPFLFSGLKPNSMVISMMGKIRILDYPLPCFLPRELQWKYARRTAPGYISPEQVRGEAPTVQSDVYNLGALYYFMITKADPSQYPYSRVRMPIQRPDHKPHMLDVLDRALADKAPQRYQTPAELKAAAGGPDKATAHSEAAFTLQTHQIDLPDIRRGEVIRNKIQLVSKTGKDLYGKLKSDQTWVRFKFDVFRGKSVELDFSIDTFDLEPGMDYQGTVLVDTEEGSDEIKINLSIAAPFGMRLARAVRGLFGRE